MQKVVVANEIFTFSSLKNVNVFYEALRNAPLHELDINLYKVKNVYHLFLGFQDLGKFTLKEYKKLLELQEQSTITLTSHDRGSGTTTLTSHDRGSGTTTEPSTINILTRIQKFGKAKKIPSPNVKYTDQFQNAITELTRRQKTVVKPVTYRQTLNKLVFAMC